MRIMILANSPVNSGFSAVAMHLATELKKLGHNIGYTGLQTFHRMEMYDGIPIYPIVGDMNQASSPDLLVLGLARNMRMHGSEALIYILSSDGKLDKLTQIHPNTVWYLVLDEELIYNPHPILNAARKVKKVVAMTHSAGKQLENQGIKHTVIYPGHDPSVIHKGFDKNNSEQVMFYAPAVNKQLSVMAGQIPELWEKLGVEFVIGFVGQNHGVRKRIELLIEAFSLFTRDKGDKVHLHLHTLPTNIPNDVLPYSITGINLIEMANYFGIKDKITFSYGEWRSSGWSEEALNNLYNTFDVFTTASSGGGFELTNFESAAIGIPQICPDVMPFNELYPDNERGLLAGGRRQFIQSGAFRFLVDPQELANKMQIMYDNRQLRDRLGRNCQTWAKQFTWQRTAEEFNKLFNGLK